MLVAPKTGEVLSLYLGASDAAVSAVLVNNDKGIHRSIFYISHILFHADTRYPLLEKLALALLMAARKLRLYFQSHTIQVDPQIPNYEEVVVSSVRMRIARPREYRLPRL
ncbi:hypothetical protein AXF42_Ash018666 [Apostasia shenzhenica]|uniref:Reverse transcriptase/retrotransposon-derived protein RNase H-like domain-containing protein n=1 Tax=Apostasia shenzhenica TaxID=1088818 RepID=A0A2I0B1L3_9ASPA|nr:hypothetical protein AXF42_Ash018666 [Apostasia shenzhenica]